MNPPSFTPTPPAIPDHEILRCIGRGSYGEVWLARSVMDTFRAVKVVYRQTFSNDRPYEREFSGLQKFEPISRRHPGLVSLLHIGRNQPAGYFFYVMEVADDLVSGQKIDPQNYTPKTLSALLENGKLPVDDCAQIGLMLTAALDFLHQQGLIHRDIKPSNIIFVNGAPKFADIGLVTDIGERATFVGTPGYIPPEGPGSPGADLYSLGKVLYEISMGKDRDEFPKLPTKLFEDRAAPQLMRLNEVLLKACDPNPRNRFLSAAEMHAALAALNSGRPREGKSQRVIPAPSSAASRVVILSSAQLPAAASLAHQLEERLDAQNFAVLVDECRESSVTWAREIEDHIRQANAIVALLSEASVQDALLIYALDFAGQVARGKGRLQLLPVRIQFPDRLPRSVELALGASPQFVWAGPQDDQRLLDELVRALQLQRSDTLARP